MAEPMGVFMSESQEVLFEKLERRFGMLLKAIWTLVIGAFIIGGWAAMMQAQISDLQKRSDDTDTQAEEQLSLLQQIDKRLAVREANQFTMQDWSRKSGEWSTSLTSMDKRVTRNEDHLDRIETGLQKILDRLEK